MWRELAFQTHWHSTVVGSERTSSGGFWGSSTNPASTHFFPERNGRFSAVEFLCWISTRPRRSSWRKNLSKNSFTKDHPHQHIPGVASRCMTTALQSAPTADSSNPLKAARFISVFRESIKRHAGDGRLPAATHLKHKLDALKSEIAGRKIIYLDVCHWINLQHVWLQSRRW